MNPRHPIIAALAVALTTLLALVVAASPAAASSRAQDYIDESVELGVVFLAEHDLTPCLAGGVRVVEAPGGYANAAEYTPGGCAIELSRDLVRAAARERWSRYGTDGERLTLCTVVAHGLEHTAGVEHTADGLMAADVVTRLARGEHDVAPYSCRAWVKSLEHRERAQAAQRHARRAARRAHRRHRSHR